MKVNWWGNEAGDAEHEPRIAWSEAYPEFTEKFAAHVGADYVTITNSGGELTPEVQLAMRGASQGAVEFSEGGPQCGLASEFGALEGRPWILAGEWSPASSAPMAMYCSPDDAEFFTEWLDRNDPIAESHAAYTKADYDEDYAG